MPLRLYTFSKNNSHVPDNTSDKFGIRGSLLLKLSELELPIAPGFIIDAETFRNIHNEDIISLIKEGVSFIEKISYKDYNQGSVPLTLKIVLSPSIDIEVLSSIHNIGINQNTLEAFSSIGGADFAYGEYRYLLQSVVHHFTDLAENPEVKQEKNDQTACEKYLAALDGLFPKDGYEQIAFLLKKYHERYFSDSLNQNIPCAVFVQMMVYGKFGNNSYNGEYFTRDINTGDNTINGFFGVGEMFTDRKHGKDLSKIDAVYYDEFKRIGHIIERHFIDVKYIRFTIERGVLWIVSIFNADQISTRSQVKMLLDMHREGVIDDNYIVSKIVPNQLNDLLHSSVDEDSKADFKSVTGGIAGSPGACIGRVYFSTKKLMDAYRDSLARGEDSRFILAMAATYAGDVQAIEIGQGVISSEGGFASHAPVVARSIGKPAIVNSDIEFTDTSMVINEVTVKEGEYITMEVNNYSDPVIYFGQVKLQSPDLENNLIFDLMKIINKYVDKFYVRANADNQKEAALAKKLGARGVGLCRTEHMFFNENRINIFREVLLTEDGEKIQKVLNELKKFQVDDFVDLFEAMEGLPITIRLLDAPLHEFIPQTIEQRELFNQSYVKRGGKHNPLEIKIIFDR
ncbi:hypothetical protein CHS0354_027397 [Potamilus streckersoni]|uniref:pyruvate, phosphate dikinase n=1 Tax=Potamilus streckersoni TaxID=2493646 RepID=A0AAE0SQD6_9BIVA|nr:hypothetical protein CHS0354_027397 [Potamilus streckersoni]